MLTNRLPTLINTQWLMIRRYSLTVAGAAPALRIQMDGRTGFPFHSRG